MAVLLHFRPVVRTVRLDLPDGSARKVKVTVNDARDTQHVEDGDVVHGTGRPASVAITIRVPSRQRKSLLLRNMGMPKMRSVFNRDFESGLWAPIPGTEQLHSNQERQR